MDYVCVRFYDACIPFNAAESRPRDTPAQRRRSLELSKAFIEEPLCVAMHPSAHSVLVGFVDKLRLFTVLLDDFK